MRRKQTFLVRNCMQDARLRESRLSQVYKVIIRVCVMSFISGEFDGTPLFELLNGKVTLNVLRFRLPRFQNCPKYLTTSNNIVLMQRILGTRLSRTNNNNSNIYFYSAISIAVEWRFTTAITFFKID